MNRARKTTLLGFPRGNVGPWPNNKSHGAVLFLGVVGIVSMVAMTIATRGIFLVVPALIFAPRFIFWLSSRRSRKRRNN